MCERGREREIVCVWEREGGRGRERDSMCVLVRKRERFGSSGES